jgi:hypothetical protein
MASVRDSVSASVGASVRDSVMASVRESVYGQHDAGWLSFYDFFAEVCGLKKTIEPLQPFIIIAKSAGWWLPCEKICFISERHNILKMLDKQLHCDGGPALQYPDGWSIWALNGVRVSQEIAETLWNELDPRLILSEKNAEVRREIVRKIGIEKVCHDLNATAIESGTDQTGLPCELISLNLGDGRKRPYIKLINPSIGTYHIEGVHPDCDTLEKAFKFRNGTSEKPIIIT